MTSAEAERPARVAVIGAADADDDEYSVALALGSALAERGAIVVCGGRGGVMEAVSRGAHDAGGIVVGILPGREEAGANEWVTIPLATGMGEARNALVVRGGQAVVSVGGGWGTLSEIALARKMGRPVATLGRPPAAGLDLPAPPDAESAAEWAIAAARV
ncbi:MAG: TIGR00725 family protein [Gemmatimonadetes bacterium]|nr:TIGR00725 family protein [Gemmatimonadota bacterium]NNF13529.1 TIGR00725 family protein [Gemmatimonadota bacterium]